MNDDGTIGGVGQVHVERRGDYQLCAVSTPIQNLIARDKAEPPPDTLGPDRKVIPDPCLPGAEAWAGIGEELRSLCTT